MEERFDNLRNATEFKEIKSKKNVDIDKIYFEVNNSLLTC